MYSTISVEIFSEGFFEMSVGNVTVAFRGSPVSWYTYQPRLPQANSSTSSPVGLPVMGPMHTLPSTRTFLERIPGVGSYLQEKRQKEAHQKMVARIKADQASQGIGSEPVLMPEVPTLKDVRAHFWAMFPGCRFEEAVAFLELESEHPDVLALNAHFGRMEQNTQKLISVLANPATRFPPFLRDLVQRSSSLSVLMGLRGAARPNLSSTYDAQPLSQLRSDDVQLAKDFFGSLGVVLQVVDGQQIDDQMGRGISLINVEVATDAWRRYLSSKEFQSLSKKEQAYVESICFDTVTYFDLEKNCEKFLGFLSGIDARSRHVYTGYRRAYRPGSFIKEEQVWWCNMVRLGLRLGVGVNRNDIQCMPAIHRDTFARFSRQDQACLKAATPDCFARPPLPEGNIRYMQRLMDWFEQQVKQNPAAFKRLNAKEV
ncbi:MAG: hypothetical protein AB7F28_05225 [Candidatus Margulisiibacteriota bacterium]